MRFERDSVGATAETLGIIGIEFVGAPMTCYIDPEDKKRACIVTNRNRVIYTRAELNAIVAEAPEILEMYA